MITMIYFVLLRALRGPNSSFVIPNSYLAPLGAVVASVVNSAFPILPTCRGRDSVAQ